jgi:hypothetical protein
MSTYRLTVLRTVVVYEHYLVDAEDQDQAVNMALDNSVEPVASEEHENTKEPIEIEKVE